MSHSEQILKTTIIKRTNEKKETKTQQQNKQNIKMREIKKNKVCAMGATLGKEWQQSRRTIDDFIRLRIFSSFT